MKEMKLFKERLKYYRENSDLTVRQVALKIGIRPEMVHTYELYEDKKPKSLHRYYELAQAIGIPLSYLVPEDEMKALSFGTKLEHYRLIQGYTKKEFAKKMGITVTQLNNYENTKELSIETMRKFAEQLEIPVEYLDGGIHKNIDLMSRGEIIRYYRIERGLKQRELAELANVSLSYINNLELDVDMKFSFPKVKRIADALEISSSLLIEDINEDLDDINSWSFGHKLRFYREQAGITCDELIDICGIDVRPYESGQIIPNVVKISVIAETIGIPTNILTDSWDIENNLFNYMVG